MLDNTRCSSRKSGRLLAISRNNTLVAEGGAILEVILNKSHCKYMQTSGADPQYDFHLWFVIFSPFNMAACRHHSRTSCCLAIVGLTYLSPVIQMHTFNQNETWCCSVLSKQHKSCGCHHFRVIFGEVSILLFRFRHNIDTTMTKYATVSKNHQY